MKLPAALLLLSLVAAFHAPLVVAASDPGMDCCAGGTEGMVCCPLSGSCSMRSCGADEREALRASMSVFVLPGSAAPMRPAPASIAPAAEVSPPVSEAFRVLDPPPRG